MQPTSQALVVATSGDTVVALDPRTGRSRWWVRHRLNPVIGAVEVGGVVWIADRQRHVVGLDPSAKLLSMAREATTDRAQTFS